MKPVPPPEALLCEACGYVLAAEPSATPPAACPECGRPAEDSLPERRDGPAWARGVGVLSFLRTVGSLLREPTLFFRRLDPGAPGLAPRLFLLVFATAAGATWTLAELLWLRRPPVLAWGFGMAAGQAVIVLTYLEVAGVAVFSRLRGWRVPLPLAEKVACYAAPGWLPGVVVALAMEKAVANGGLERSILRLTGDPLAADALFFGVLVLAMALAVLPYESLVHRGVRAVRFANGRGCRPR